jgi:hypothetical protein
MINFAALGLKPPRTYGPYKTESLPAHGPGSSFSRYKLSTIHFPKIAKPEGLNIFRQLWPEETEHSAILAELLNPKGKHGYNDTFLSLFFKIVVNDLRLSADKNESWIVTAEKDRFDVRLRNLNNSQIIIIENKSNYAEDQEHQLYRYWYNGIYYIQKNLCRLNIPVFSKILYLSPSFEKQPSEQSVSRPPNFNESETLRVPPEIIKVVYFNEEITAWLSSCIKAVDPQSEMFFYLKQYREFWSV